jgi:superfamily II DNA or RNA helicase
MKKAVLSNRIYLNRTGTLHEELTKALSYTIFPRSKIVKTEIVCDVTRINKDILTIPSGRLDLIPEDYEIIDKRIYKPIYFPKFKFELRDSQQDIYDKCTDSGLICANPSWGKTFMGVALASKFKQKTLIIVHKVDLMNQWVKEIDKCLDIVADRIGGGFYNYSSPIVVGTMQTIKNNITELGKQFGTIIVDECHHVPADVFKTIIDKMNARYKLGLTATPWRRDGKHVFLQDYFGDQFFKPKDENRIDPTILMYNSEIPLSSNMNIPWGTRLTDLYNRHDFLELVVNLSHIQAQKGHLVLTVADRVEFLKHCSDILEEDSMLIIAESKDRDFLASNKSILFGSTRIFSEGINIPPLSSLVLGLPLNNPGLLEQLIGRIARIHEGKKDPEVIDIVLKGKTGANQARQRLGFYMDKGYQVKQL